MSTCEHYVVASIRRGGRPFHIIMRPCAAPAVVTAPHPACTEHAHTLAVSA